MSPLFPPEILGQTTESLFVERHSRTNAIYITLVVLIVTAFALLPLVKVEVTAQSRGIIRSACENNRITASHNGRIEWINIQPNQTVIKGDTLLVLNTDRLQEEMAWHREQIDRDERYIRDLEKMTAPGKQPVDLHSLLYRSTYARYTTRIREYQNELDKAERDFIIHNKLYKEAVIASQLLQEKKYLYEQAMAAFTTFKKQSLLEWQNELEKIRLQQQEHRSMLGRLRKESEQYIITAPVGGVITQHAGLQPGNFVVPNQVVAEISPEKDLLVECYLSPSDIGMIRDSMQVRFQFDAFNHNHWGLGQGTVKDISHDVITQNDEPAFKVRCYLHNRELRLKNGYTGRLRKGMTLTARFRITRRTLLQLLYDKVDDWLNPNIQKKNTYT